jgi:hypothetical protein
MASRVASNLRADPGSRIPLAMLPAPPPSSLPRARASRYRKACSELAVLVRRAQGRQPRHRHTDGKSSYSLSSAPNRINIEQGG